MAFDPKNKDHVQALVGSHWTSRQRLEPFRVSRKTNLKTFLGTMHSPNAAETRQPINHINLAVLIYMRLLVSNDPQALVTTKYRDLRSMAADLQEYINWRIGDMKLVDTLRLITFDALFCMGIGTVGIDGSKSYEWEGDTHCYGEPFFDHIDFDNWVHDMRATRRAQWSYCGHLYTMPLDVALADERFDPDVRERLERTPTRFFNETGDERVHNIELDSMAPWLDDDQPSVECWQIYRPRENLLMHWTTDNNGRLNELLCAEEFEGPKGGPYKYLTFVDTPSNTMPSAPVTNLAPLNSLINVLYAKLGDQAVRQKKVTFFRGKGEQDAKRLQDASDGEGVHVENPEDTREVSMGGIDQTNFAFVNQSVEIFNQLSGNIRTMGGLAADEPTLGQEQIVQQNSSAQLKDMQKRCAAFAKDVIGADGLAWYWVNNDVDTYEVERKIKGVPFSTMAKITPQQRANNHLKLNFDINAVSIVAHTPQELVQQMDEMMMKIILPSAQVLQSQNGAPNIQGYLSRRAELLNFPYLDELVTFQATPEGDPQPKDEPPRFQQPNSPTMNVRANVTRNAPQKTAQLLQGLGNQQPSQNGAVKIGG